MLIEAGANSWSFCDSPDMHIVQAWNTILQLFIIWFVGILFESGVDDGRTYRQVAGSWVCSWWVTAVGKGSTTFEPVVWIQSRFNTNSSSEIAQKLRLVSKRLCMETTGNLLFFSISNGFRSFPWFLLRHQQPWDHIKAMAVRWLIAL